MALVVGTNCGFLSSAPTSDPESGDGYIPGYATASKHTSPAGTNSISSMGVYVGVADAGNMELGIYSHDAANNRPNALLASSGDISRGTNVGWKTGSVSYNLAASTTYWLATQHDNGTGSVRIDMGNVAGTATHTIGASSALPDPYGSSAFYANFVTSIYAIYAAAGGTLPIPQVFYRPFAGPLGGCL